MILNRHSSTPARNNTGGSAIPGEELTRNKILEALPGPERAMLWSIGEEVSLVRGELVAKGGEPYRHVYFPEDAVFSLITDFSNGNSVESGTVGNEGFVGLPRYLGAESCPQRTIAQIPGRACRIPFAAFESALPELPALSDILNRYLLAYIAQVSQTAGCNSQHTVIQRCARWTLLTHDRIGQHKIPLTQEFLAYMLGVRRPSVTVAQAELQRMGLIRYTRGKMDVLNREGLEQQSCECYCVVRREFAGLTRVAVGQEARSSVTLS
jgi:CRP-like cAMP-binding protein